METVKAFFEWLKKKVSALLGDKETPRASASSSARARPSEPYVFVTPRGKKYHWDRLCPSLRSSREIKMDISKARKAGYTACDKCCSDNVHKYD